MAKGKKYDSGKLRYDLENIFVRRAKIAGLTFGAIRYGAHNWRSIENLEERYIAAFERHFNAYRGGEFFDDDSGFPHLALAQCCLEFLTAINLEEIANMTGTSQCEEFYKDEIAAEMKRQEKKQRQKKRLLAAKKKLLAKRKKPVA